MAIQRITDLGQLVVDDDKIDNFKNSYIEISYEEQLDQHQFKSYGMQIGDFMQALGLADDTGDVLSGDFIYNFGDEGDENTYKCQLNFGNQLHVRSNNIQMNASDGTQIAGFMSGDNGLDMNDHRVVSMKDPSNDQDAVTLSYLKSYVEDYFESVKSQLTAGIPKTTAEELLSDVYPVSSLYITTSTDDQCPLSSIITGSEWQLVSDGYFLATSNDQPGTTSEGKTTFSASDFTFSTCKATAITHDKGHAQDSFIKNISLAGVSSSGIRPPSYTVRVWRRTK